MPRVNLTGQRFGRWTALYDTGETAAGGNRLWLCRCDCGTERVLRSASLRLKSAKPRQKASQSCGCLMRELARDSHLKHGHAQGGELSAEYRTWMGMKARCYQQRHSSYAFYGAKGIIVCDRWRQSFDAFLADVGPRPSPKHTLDRINSRGHYEPGNVRWATMKQQQLNRTNNRWITAFGRTQTVTQWADELHMDPRTIRQRISAGATTEQALQSHR